MSKIHETDKTPVLITPEDIEMTDCSIGDFDDHDTLFYCLSKEKTAEVFKTLNYTPENMYDEEDDNYDEGDLQVDFDRESSDINEILLAPVYEIDDAMENGPGVTLRDELLPDCIPIFKEDMRKLREKEENK